jgi:hypothetical protein
MSVTVLELAASVAAVLLFGAGATAAWLWYRRRAARRRLLERIDAMAVERVSDVLLPDGAGGHMHIDFLLLTPRGLLILDLRDLQGMIFGSEQMREWTVMARTRRFQFANPLGPLYDRIAAVKSLAGDGVPVEGRVVFSDRGEFPKGHPRLAVRLASLVAEFPPADAAAQSPQAAGYEAGWARVKAAVTPSPLRRP